jgi:hypothetical protein
VCLRNTSSNYKAEETFFGSGGELDAALPTIKPNPASVRLA